MRNAKVYRIIFCVIEFFSAARNGTEALKMRRGKWVLRSPVCCIWARSLESEVFSLTKETTGTIETAEPNLKPLKQLVMKNE